MVSINKLIGGLKLIYNESNHFIYVICRYTEIICKLDDERLLQKLGHIILSYDLPSDLRSAI
ncbi:hypothetical protein bsdcttw_42520 [Anaerocolumna chitinilytica]|uniref:Uncharacterized protein n=1 Tax=Anaerocolumna chitinilytica TaxID=1727145 RepID=A0A7M3S9E4_9FIRM|nr:hypothetical protein bsdcttw_42520 [Anaerocolumna chitinilytica]